MATHKTIVDTDHGQQPEALRALKVAAEAGGVKPDEQGMTATSRTRPPAEEPDAKNREAARILEAGAEGRTVTPRPPAR